DLDVVGLDGVDRDRAAGVRHAVRVQAERVALGHAVHGDVVEAVVDAGHGNRTACLVDHGDARVEARHVVDRAAGLRHDLEFAAAHRGADALGVGGEQVLRGAGHDGDRAQVGDRRVQYRVDVGDLVQLQVDVLARGRAFACLVDG